MALFSVLETVHLQEYPLLVFVATILLVIVAHAFYRCCLDPLSSVPGPLICRLTPLWSWYHTYIGDESRRIFSLHERYGPVVRIGPNEVVIADGTAIAPIYVEKGGFLKAPAYSNFDADGFVTIFSALDPLYRAPRSKAVMPMFSTSSLRTGSGAAALDSCVARLIVRLRAEAERSGRLFRETGRRAPVDVLDLARCFSLDAATSYLFGRDFEALGEASTEGEKGCSAAPYVDDIATVGRFFFLPPWLFHPVFALYARLRPTPGAAKSSARVQAFTKALTFPVSSAAGQTRDTFQSRLLAAGCSPRETCAQMDDVLFAATDSTGTNLVHLIYRLASLPSVSARLRSELAAASPSRDVSELPYLQAVVREGLRLSLSNPARFARVVPPAGFLFSSSAEHTFHFPAGTLVGCAPYTMHLNPSVFPDPLAFRPERWLDAEVTQEMLRDHIPFGAGARQCIARNLASRELLLAVRAIATEDILRGAKTEEGAKWEVKEWFNARVEGAARAVWWEASSTEQN